MFDYLLLFMLDTNFDDTKTRFDDLETSEVMVDI
jgi:hypothetical protein